MNKITLPIAILLSAIVLSGGFYAAQYNKGQSIERQQQIELKAKADVRQEEVEQSQTEVQIQANNSSIINTCISAAQEERDRRKGNLSQNLLDYLKDHNYRADETYRYMEEETANAKVKIDKKYGEWLDGCKRGINPNLSDFVY